MTAGRATHIALEPQKEPALTEEKIERLKSLLKSLHEESEELLLKNNVWSSYGWQDQIRLTQSTWELRCGS